MSPEQLLQLQNLTQLFEEGLAGPKQIQELSELLAAINKTSFEPDFIVGPTLFKTII
ncbi:MAG: hypothetical protein ACPG46_12225 [Thalassotalea sp.]